MHILITDSGVGGLSVCAYAEMFLRTHGVKEAMKLTYVNAAPENDFGYNAMGSRVEKIENFNRFLNIVSNAYSPDSIYIACNTLSVLFSETEISKIGRIPVQGIVETGVNRLLEELEQNPRSNVVIFGTDTTIEENTYAELLQQNGIDKARIVSQACPSLADTISEDRTGAKAQKKIEEYVDIALAKSGNRENEFLLYLACTHYGYRKDFFADYYNSLGLKNKVLNPNEFVAEKLFDGLDLTGMKGGDSGPVEVEFITRYEVPETALETISFFLEDISPATVRAFTGYTHAPDLF